MRTTPSSCSTKTTPKNFGACCMRLGPRCVPYAEKSRGFLQTTRTRQHLPRISNVLRTASRLQSRYRFFRAEVPARVRRRHVANADFVGWENIAEREDNVLDDGGFTRRNRHVARCHEQSIEPLGVHNSRRTVRVGADAFRSNRHRPRTTTIAASGLGHGLLACSFRPRRPWFVDDELRLRLRLRDRCRKSSAFRCSSSFHTS
jgi:hypothetical protein